MNRKYSPEHIEWLKENITGCHFKELTDMFNKQFGMDLKITTMISLTDRYGLHNGLDTRFKDYLINGGIPYRFKKGHMPFNKGKKAPAAGNLHNLRRGKCQLTTGLLAARG